MRRHSLIRLAGLGTLAIVLAGTMAAYAAANTVPSTRMDEDNLSISANDLKPAACSGINLTNIVTGGGLIFGSGGADLVLGSAGGDLVFALSGDDCILTGSGNDTIFAGAGNDVCDGGSGTDSAADCETTINIP